jgi:hypothetical protein
LYQPHPHHFDHRHQTRPLKLAPRVSHHLLTRCTRERNHQRSPHASNYTAAIRHDTSPRRIASICHHQTGRRQTELIRGLKCSRARTVLRSAECFHAQERQKTQKTGKVPSLASQKATTCCPLAIVAEGRSATFSSRALHLCITARRISIRLLRDLNLFVLTLHYRGCCPVSYTPALPVCRQGACQIAVVREVIALKSCLPSPPEVRYPAPPQPQSMFQRTLQTHCAT